MYIVLETNCSDHQSVVIFASSDPLEGNQQFVEHIAKLTALHDSAHYISKTVSHIFKKNLGWVSNSRDLAYVIQLIHFNDPDIVD